MRRLLLPLLAVSVLAAPAAASAAHYKIGISDQSAATFVDPLFPALKTSMARYVTPWDVMNPGRVADKNNLINWVDHARAAHQSILIAFETSHKFPRKAPTVTQYTKAIRRFQQAYPDIHNIQAWNEVNR